jgi:pyridoxal phosphate enzyme (YggS family)
MIDPGLVVQKARSCSYLNSFLGALRDLCVRECVIELIKRSTSASVPEPLFLLIFAEQKVIFNIFMSATLISENVNHIRERIAAACQQVKRLPGSVKIVAVTKYVDATRISAALDAGIEIIGENRVQEAWQKYQSIDRPCQWHMVGHLQRNKVKRALQFATLIQSVDSLHLAEEINRQADKLGRQVDVLIQVNTSGEESKFGLNPEETVEVIRRVAELRHVRITGLMTIGAFLPDPEDVRPCFARLRQLRSDIARENITNVDLAELSMGMSNDFEVAIEEGATMVRLGRLLFGERTLH